jgi:hypothetical protein
MSEINTPEAVNAAINETIALLDTNYNFDEVQGRNVVLFVGVTGAGKSTASQFLAGNPKLKAMKDEFTNSFYITDGDDRVSESTSQSKTSIPELIPIPNTDTVLVDCPGFSDTRGVKHDIASTFFTKQVLERTKHVKIMATTSYHTLRKGVDRTGFTKLLDHLLQFINDIDKYKDSIGLLVTKVDNEVEETEDGKFKLVSDEQMIENIGRFLVEVQAELEMEKRDELAKLMHVFIEKSDFDKYSRIGIFRRPTTVVRDLQKDEKLLKNRKYINKVIKKLESVKVEASDFGLSLSTNSMHFLAKMREILQRSLSDILDDYIRVYTHHQPHEIADNLDSIKSSITRSNSVIDFLETAIVPEMSVANLMEHIQKLNPEHPTEPYAEWKRQQKYLQFLETISPLQEEYSEYDKYGIRLFEFKNTISINVQKLGEKAGNIIHQRIKLVITKIITTIQTEIFNLDVSSQLSYKKLIEHIKKVYKSWSQFQSKTLKKPKLSFNEFFNEFRETSSVCNVSSSHIQRLEDIKTEIDFLKGAVTSTLTDGHQLIWLEGFYGPIRDIGLTINWLSFIIESYDILIEYDSQNLITTNMQHLKTWKNFKMLRQQMDTKKNDFFLKSHTALSANQQVDLNNLIDSIQSSLEYSCESSKLVVKDNLVALSKVVSDLFPKCPSFQELYVFATQTVFLDETLVLPGKNVYIFAPIMKILGIQTINLRGSDGVPKENLEALSMAGNPGQSGGNFVGASEDVVNGNSLTIDVSGGNGGDGVIGRTGEKGVDGDSPRPYHARLVDWYGYASKVKIVNNTFTKKVLGTDGTPGSRGGAGGKAGYGAMPGTILFSPPEIHKLAQPGQNGANGPGGHGGIGGEHGKIRHYENLNPFCIIFVCWEEVLEEDRGNAASGDDGVAGVYGDPVEATPPQSYATLPTVAQQYKEYARQKHSPFVESLEFINRYDSNNSRRRRSVRAIHGAPLGDNYDSTPQPLAIDHKSGTLENKSWPTGFSLSSFVTLADLLIRKLKKTSPTHVETQADPNWENLLVQAEVLNIVEKCEAKWNEVDQKEVPLQKPFDPVCLQKELTRRMIQLADMSEVPQIEADILGNMFL